MICMANVYLIVTLAAGTVLDAILDVFDSLGQWFVTFVPTLFSLFWNSGSGDTTGSLTFLGVLAVAGLAISVVFLVVGLIQNFLHFRG